GAFPPCLVRFLVLLSRHPPRSSLRPCTALFRALAIHACRSLRVLVCACGTNLLARKAPRPGEGGPSEVRPLEVRVAEVRPGEVRPREVGPSESRPRPVRPAEVRLAEVRLGEVRL